MQHRRICAWSTAARIRQLFWLDQFPQQLAKLVWSERLDRNRPGLELIGNRITLEAGEKSKRHPQGGKTLCQRNARPLSQPQIEKGCMELMGVQRLHSVRDGANADNFAYAHSLQDGLCVNSDQRLILYHQDTQAGRQHNVVALQRKSPVQSQAASHRVGSSGARKITCDGATCADPREVVF